MGTFSKCLENRFTYLEILNISINCISSISEFDDLLLRIMKNKISFVEIEYLAIPRANSRPFFLANHDKTCDFFESIEDFRDKIFSLSETSNIKIYKLIVRSS